MTPSLYIHIPFCEKKCPFCSFAVAASQMNRCDEYIGALEKEALSFKGTPVMSVYVGGGTPSCLSLAQMERLWAVIAGNFCFSSDCEKTFEANPESMDPEKARLLKSLGINRVSLGLQSMNDERLKYLGRGHNVFKAKEAFKTLRSAGFKNLNVDLMYGFPGQTPEELDADFRKITALGSEHLSIYNLTIEKKSLFYVQKKSVDNETQGRLYELILRRAHQESFFQYEVSNFSRQGFESRHNLNYWQGGEYIGLGVAAHSHLEGRRRWNVDTLPLYLAAMRDTKSAMAGSEELLPGDKFMETFLFGLRMNSGVDLYALERRMKVKFPEGKSDELGSLIEAGFLEEDGPVVRVTDKGRLVLDEISARLI
ncbi:MAG: radical SAM family heme chaperone HemW [Candidatus Omnitrophica bacterium]|nr:radical SAM family heme chaperone HemW [Candidatus Omnitrophota bacterium]